MNGYSSIGALLKEVMKCRNRSIKDTADYLNIKYTTFSAQLINNTLSAETLFRLASYLGIDLNWMMAALGYLGAGNSMDKAMIPRMTDDFRELELTYVHKQLDRVIYENPTSVTDARRELLNTYGQNVFYLLDVLVPDDYKIYMVKERDKTRYYVDVNDQPPTRGRTVLGRCKPISTLYNSNEALDTVIEQRKKDLL